MIKRAHSYKVHFCGHCPNAHIVYKDETGKWLLEATMTADQAINIAASIRARRPSDPPTGVFGVEK